MGNREIAVDALAALLAKRPDRPRTLVAIAGPPGGGKSTVAAHLASTLNAATPDRAAVVPMDGFHYDDAVLDARGLRARKGAPETFDVGGLAHLLGRLRRDGEDEIAVPLFDRDLEVSRAGAGIVSRAARIVLVEGNYLLLTRPQWSALAGLFDVTVMLRVPLDELRQRLTARWLGYALTPAAIAAKVDGNDLPNARLVLEHSAAADYAVAG